MLKHFGAEKTEEFANVHEDGGLGKAVENEMKYSGVESYSASSNAEHYNTYVFDTGVSEESLDVVDSNEVDSGDEYGDERSDEDDHTCPLKGFGFGQNSVETKETDKTGVHNNAGEHGSSGCWGFVFGIDASGEHGNESHFCGVAHKNKCEGHLEPEGVEFLSVGFEDVE